MRILLINACHYLRGGSEIVYFNTARLLMRNGHEVAYFSTKDPKNEKSDFEDYFLDYENIRELSLVGKIRKVPLYLYNLEAKRKLERLINDFKPEVAHIHIFYGALSVSVLKTLKKHNIPIVHTIHDYRLLCPVNTLIDRFGKVCELCRDKHFYHCVQKRCSEGKITQSMVVMLEAYFWKYFINPVKLIDYSIFVSNFSKEKHLEFNISLSGKFTQIYNFTHFTNKSENITRGEYFLYFGRLSSEKGMGTLISAFSSSKSYKLKIAGTGPLKEMVEQASRSDLNISYVGFKTGKDLEDLITNASFVILPSECYENNPLTVVEAYSFGKPVIGAKIAGIPELIKDKFNGFLFKSGDQESLRNAIEASSNLTDAEYEHFSVSVYNFAQENFNIRNHYLSLMKVYNDLIIKGKT